MGGSEENSKAQTEEIQRWNGFAKVLRTEDKLAFDEVMNTYQRIASGNSDGTDLAPFEKLAFSVTVGQMAKLNELRGGLTCLNRRSQSRNLRRRNRSRKRPYTTTSQRRRRRREA